MSQFSFRTEHKPQVRNTEGTQSTEIQKSGKAEAAD
jgi:hypothetical protein